MKRFQVLRRQHGGAQSGAEQAENVMTESLGHGVLVVDTFKDGQVVFITDAEYVKAQRRGDVE